MQEPIIEVELEQGHITLLGTAHVSKTSAEAVETLLNTGDYDAVAIELCPSRHHSLVNPDSLAQMDLFQVFKKGRTTMVMASLALGAYQQRLAEQFGIEPGAEMRAAIGSAQQHDLPVWLIDREVGTTLKRVYRSVPWWKRMGLFTGLLAGVMSKDDIDEAEIEKLKQGDILENTFNEFAQEEEALYTPLIDERDQYMAARLREEIEQTPGKKILAVIGAGHLQGIANYLNAAEEPADQAVKRLDELPKPAQWPKWVPWIIVAIILTGFAIGFTRSPELGWQLVLDWVLINGALAAVGAAIALAHPLTVITAFIAAPLTSLNPTVGAGMVTAGMELWLRKPTVGDFMQLRHATTTLKGWWQNRVSRILLVFFFSTLGSAAGTYIAGFKIFDRLFT